VIVAVDGAPVTRFVEIERAVQAEGVSLTLLRDGAEVEVALDTHPLSGAGVDRFVIWSGLTLHAPHFDLAAQRGLDPDGVLIVAHWSGSPGTSARVYSHRLITAVDETPTPDLDAFLAAVAGRSEGAVTLRLKDYYGKEEVRALILDPVHWPTWELRLGEDGWRREAVAP